ncbi:MAG TPA: hypothetical protein GXZ96_03590 [Firmicutes bacterium]|nr:hypothetical protein [Bacillota bacterium]
MFDKNSGKPSRPGSEGFCVARVRLLGILLISLLLCGAFGFPAQASERVTPAINLLHVHYADQNHLNAWETLGLKWSGGEVRGRYQPGETLVASDYAREMLGIMAAGYNPRAFQGTDYVQPLLGAQQANGSFAGQVAATAWAITALDLAGVAYDQEAAVSYLLGEQDASGGWRLAGDGDVDLTAMVLIALSGHSDRPDVAAALAAGLTFLESCRQVTADGMFFVSPGKAKSCESTAAALEALIALGEEPLTDPRWSLDGKTALDGLLSFQLADGTYCHTAGGGPNSMATYQALGALADLCQGSSKYRQLAVDAAVEPVTVSVRVEGLHETILETVNVAVSETIVTDAQGNDYDCQDLTAYGALVAALGGEHTFSVDYSFGMPFVTGIGGESNGQLGGFDGWSYAVIRAGVEQEILVGAADFVLQEGDLIVWYYGQWDVTEGLALLSVSASEAELGDQVTVTVTDYAGHPVVGAWVSFGSQAAATDAQGQAVFMVREAGTLLVSAELTDNAGLPILVRAEKKSVVVEPVPVRVRVEGVSTTLVPERLVTLASTAVPDAIGYDSGAPSVYAALVSALQDLDHTVSYEWGSPFVTGIAGEMSGQFGGWDGWNFAVVRAGARCPVEVGPGDFAITAGDQVIWYYGDFDTPLIDLQVSESDLWLGDELTVTLKTLPAAGTQPVPCAGATVTVGGQEKITDASGTVTFAMDTAGDFVVVAEQFDGDGKPVLVRATQQVTVGGSIACTVQAPASFLLGQDADLQVEVTNQGQATPVLVVFALYDLGDGALMSYSYLARNLAAGEVAQVVGGMALPEQGNYEVRVLIWDAWDSMRALAPATIIPVQ